MHWNFFGDTPDFDFVDWNFNDPENGQTADDYAWLAARIHADGHDIYVADFDHLGVYACRILVPGMSDIYPVEDLLLANNTMGAHLRETILALPALERLIALARLTGYAEGVLQGMHLSALFQDEQDYELLWRQQQQALAATGRWQGERRLRRRDGRTLWVQVSKRRVGAAGEGAGIICSYVDVDERRRAREAVQLQAERTRAILDSVLVGIWSGGALILLAIALVTGFNPVQKLLDAANARP